MAVGGLCQPGCPASDQTPSGTRLLGEAIIDAETTRSVGQDGLANEQPGRLGNDWARAHIEGMNNRPTPRLLEVTVTAQEPTRWKWRVSEANLELAHGYATSRETAQIDGDTALFAMLSEGFK